MKYPVPGPTSRCRFLMRRRYRSTSALVGHRQTNQATKPRTTRSYKLSKSGV